MEDEHTASAVFGVSASEIYEEFVKTLDEDTRAAFLNTSVEPISLEKRFSYDLTPGYHVAFQRLCHAIGLGYYDMESFTVCHPILGPWFAL